MEEDLADRVALVTGAAQGIGRATAERLLERGARVAVKDLDPGRVQSTARELGPEALPVSGDVTDSASVRVAVERTLEHFGRLDILVSCAGILYATRFEQIPEHEWRRTIEVNLTGVFLSMQAVVAPMKANGYGRIVYLSSTAGKSVSTLGGAHYTASKAGVLAQFARA